MSKKVLVAGNCTIDLVFKCNALESREKGNRWSLAHGGKYLVDYHLFTYGGGGANAAVSLARQNIDTWLYCMLGNDHFTSLIIQNLKRNKVKTDLVFQHKDNNAVSAVIIDKTGDKTIFNYRSSSDRLPTNKSLLKVIDKVDGISLYSLANWPKKDKLNFLSYAHARQKKVFLSLHGTEYKKGLEYLKDYFIHDTIIQMNAYEMADLIGKKVNSINFYHINFAKILKLPIVIVTYDLNGSFAYTQNKIYYQNIIGPRKAVDATGAGDAFSSGFFGTYLKTNDIKKSLYFGAANAGSVIQHYGAQNILLKSSQAFKL